jgi:hypothetical protein
VHKCGVSPNWLVKLTRILPDFCGHKNLTENVSYGKNWSQKTAQVHP